MSTSTTNCESPLLLDLVKYFNLTENKAKETLKNKELSETFSEIIAMVCIFILLLLFSSCNLLYIKFLCIFILSLNNHLQFY